MRPHLEDLSVDGRIMLKRILQKYDKGRRGTGLIWHSIRTSSWFLWMWHRTVGFSSIKLRSWVAKGTVKFTRWTPLRNDRAGLVTQDFLRILRFSSAKHQPTIPQTCNVKPSSNNLGTEYSILFKAHKSNKTNYLRRILCLWFRAS